MGLLDSPIVQQLAPALEKAINLALAMDPGSQKKLKPLNGCVLELRNTSIKRSFFFSAQEGKVVLLPIENTPSVTISGSTLSFIKLASYRDKNPLFRSKEITLSGDAVRAQQIQIFASAINVDWEGVLAEVIGDVPAHILGSTVKQGYAWSKLLSSSLIRDVEEFVKYEIRVLPSKAIAASQFEAIDQLRLATDRLEARLKNLVKKQLKERS